MKPRVAVGISRYSVAGTGPNPTALEFVEGLEGTLPELLMSGDFSLGLTCAKHEGKRKSEKELSLQCDLLSACRSTLRSLL